VNKTRIAHLQTQATLAPVLEDEKHQLDARRMQVILENEEAFRRAERRPTRFFLRIVLTTSSASPSNTAKEGERSGSDSVRNPRSFCST